MVDRPTILSESHRQSSFSSTASNTDQDHSPLDSPNGSVASVGHSQIDFSQKLNMKIGDTMEFHYMDEYESDGNISGEPPPDQKFTTTKRDIHTINEQRRRDQIKQGYAHLMDIVPTCHPSSSGNKPSRAVILQRSIEYITYLQNQSIKQKDKEDDLEKEVQALRIMKENYEQIARAHQSTTSQGIQQVPDHVKFLVFRGIACLLYTSPSPRDRTRSRMPSSA